MTCIRVVIVLLLSSGWSYSCIMRDPAQKEQLRCVCFSGHSVTTGFHQGGQWASDRCRTGKRGEKQQSRSFSHLNRNGCEPKPSISGCISQLIILRKNIYPNKHEVPKYLGSKDLKSLFVSPRFCRKEV